MRTRKKKAVSSIGSIRTKADVKIRERQQVEALCCLAPRELSVSVSVSISEQGASRANSMVSSHLVEALSSPTDVLLSFYDIYDHESINEFPKAVAKHFSDIFRTEEALLEVLFHLRLNF
jgi:hypothetical protein